MGDDGGLVAKQAARTTRVFCGFMALLCFWAAYWRLPGALYGEPAPVIVQYGKFGAPAPPMPMWTDQHQAMCLVAVYAVLGFVFLFLAVRPKPKPR